MIKTVLRILAFIAGLASGVFGIIALLVAVDEPDGIFIAMTVFFLMLCAVLMFFGLHRSPQEKVERAARRQAEAARIEEGKAGQKTYTKSQSAQGNAAGSSLGSAIEITDRDQSITCPDWIVLDVETTGLHPDTDRIIEFAARRYKGGTIESEYSTLIFPDRRLPKEISQLTGISDKELLRAPHFAKVVHEIWAFIGGLPVVAHNASFDSEFLVYEFARAGIALNISYIDTVRMARLAFPGLKNYKLNTLIHELDLLDHDQDHRAMSDVEATAKLYQLCRERIPGLQEEKRREEEQEALEDKAYHLNQYGMQAEAAGDIEKAIRYYEDVVADKACLPHSYIRLAIIYKKQKRWEDVVRICDAALSVLPGTPGKWCQPEEYEKRRSEAIAKIEAS